MPYLLGMSHPYRDAAPPTDRSLYAAWADQAKAHARRRASREVADIREFAHEFARELASSGTTQWDVVVGTARDIAYYINANREEFFGADFYADYGRSAVSITYRPRVRSRRPAPRTSSLRAA